MTRLECCSISKFCKLMWTRWFSHGLRKSEEVPCGWHTQVQPLRRVKDTCDSLSLVKRKLLGDDKFPKTTCQATPHHSRWNDSFVAPDTVWSSRQSPWPLTVLWKTGPWRAGCSTSGRDTRCVWTASLRLWMPWAYVVLEMASTRMGERTCLKDFSYFPKPLIIL